MAATCPSVTLIPRQRKSTRLGRLVAVALVVCMLVGPGAVFVAVQLPNAAKQSLQASLRQPWHDSFSIESNHASHRPSFIAGLATGFTAFAAVALWARGSVSAARHQALRHRNPALSLSAEGTVASAAVTQDAEQEEQFKTMCTTLMRRIGAAEKIMAQDANSDGVLDFDEFQSLLKQLEFDCETHQARALFKVLDTDESGTIDVGELKATLRNSGVIEGIYQEGLQNTFKTLIPAAALAVAFGVVKGPSAGLDFVTAYVVEDSLSVDNLFVFLAIFQYFKVSPELQKTCLDLGIYGAVVLRFLFIFVGLAAVQTFKPVLLLFAGVLLYASYSALASGEDDEDDEDEGPPDVVKDFLAMLPTTPDFVGDKLWVDDPKGGFLFTPLLSCIVAIELSDILFAVDSVPAVFAVTSDPLIVYTSNILAILGLRSLYQVLSIAVQDLVYLETAVAAILGFVGFKLAGEVVGFELDSSISLAVIVSTLAIGIIASKLEDGGEQDTKKVKQKNVLSRLVDDVAKVLGL